MAKFTADPESMQRVASTLEDKADEYRSIYQQLVNTATGMGEAYDSADNRQFVSKIQECCQDLQKMEQKLRIASTIIKGQAAAYRSTEEFNTEQAGKLGT